MRLLALLLLSFPALAVDGTSAQRTAFAKVNACPVTGKFLLTCAGYQVVWDRPPCMAGAQLVRLKMTATQAKARSSAWAAACTRSKVAYDACMAQPVIEIVYCMTSGCTPYRKWRDCSALIK